VALGLLMRQTHEWANASAATASGHFNPRSTSHGKLSVLSQAVSVGVKPTGTVSIRSAIPTTAKIVARAAASGGRNMPTTGGSTGVRTPSRWSGTGNNNGAGIAPHDWPILQTTLSFGPKRSGAEIWMVGPQPADLQTTT